MQCRRFRVPFSALVILPALLSTTLEAQQGASTWKFEPRLSVTAEYDDNVYLLSSRQQARIGAPPAGSPASRFGGMESASDVITQLRAELQMRGNGMGGRTLAITPEVGYDLYSRNGDRSQALFGLTATQNLRHGSRARLQAEYTPSTFFKNYLVEATDADLNGSISTAERLYAPASYAERMVSGEYRLRLRDGKKSSPTSVYLDVGAGYYARRYDAPFAVRDQDGPVLTGHAILQRGPLELDLGYEFASLGATPGRAVRLLDEADFGQDFNGNGNATDNNARANELVDYSRTEHEVSLGAGIALEKRADLHLDLARRSRTFGSEQPYDIGNNGRRDSRFDAGATVAVRVAPGVRLLAGIETQSQAVNRALDQVGEVTDYSRVRASVGFRYAP